MRTDSELILNYLKKTKDLNYTRSKDSFILWKIRGKVLEIHDIYSEDVDHMLKFATEFVNQSGCRYLEGYVDKWYGGKDRSIKLLENFGMEKTEESDDFITYFKSI